MRPRQEQALEPLLPSFRLEFGTNVPLRIGTAVTFPTPRHHPGVGLDLLHREQMRPCRCAGAGSPQDLCISERFLQNGLSEPCESVSDCFSSEEAQSRASPEASSES